jgi:hypothetical protein
MIELTPEATRKLIVSHWLVYSLSVFLLLVIYKIFEIPHLKATTVQGPFGT